MRVDAIKNGIVLDHIEAGRALEIYHLLSLDKVSCPVAILTNVSSEKMGKKDIIKIDGALSLPLEILGVISPSITIVLVEDGKVREKRHVSLPKEVTDFLRCKNPRCITSTEQGIHHRFHLTGEKNAVYRCVYCDAQWS
ncbi:MAG: aspartate carbamoyltransferase regulatory subunit [Clostridia bacterium]|nr:aspartate carbamoyltransferase regulatory subunit [Clostridia bacterium]